MGIRFFCPQGHKLNVKSFLAGKTGFCPYCNAKVEIPLTSTRETSKKSKGGGQAEAYLPLAVPVSRPGPRGPNATSDKPDVAPERPAAASEGAAPAAQPIPMARPVTARQSGVPMAVPINPKATPAAATRPAAPSRPGGNQALQPAFAAASATGPAAPGGASPAIGPPDPIAEAPQAVWYVRPATGGQFGPAAGDIMQQWLDEGRVAPDSLVWREGWPDWRTAATTFPKFGRAD